MKYFRRFLGLICLIVLLVSPFLTILAQSNVLDGYNQVVNKGGTNKNEEDGVIVSKSDQYQLLLLMPKMNSDAEENVKLLNDLPESISSLLNPSIDIDSVKKISLFIAILYLISAIFNYIEDFSLILSFVTTANTGVLLSINEIVPCFNSPAAYASL